MQELEKPLTEPQIRCICHEMCEGLDFLHQNFVIHRDLKAGNVLLTADGQVRLGHSFHRACFCLSLWPPCGIGQAIIFLPCCFLLLSFFFFVAYSHRSEIRCLPYFHTCGLSANLECMSEMCCARLAENAGCKKKLPKNRHLGTIAQLCQAISLQLRHVSTIVKELVKQQYLLHMSLEYRKHRSTSG